jgi:2-dehydropantoate 2-reductase
MRYVVYGAGAVGGTIGGRLAQHGKDVTLIARGQHLDALRRDGLRLQWPEGEEVLPVHAVGSPAEASIGKGDVVVLAMKTQHAATALAELVAAAPDVPVVCAQNGVENERLALRAFTRVYGICVMLPATHLEPGVVQAHGTPLSGILDVGRYPRGTDNVAEQVARDLDSSGFSSRADAAIMRMKYRKLVMNLGNALDALCGRNERAADLYRQARREAYAVFEAAGIEAASREEDHARRDGVLRIAPIPGAPESRSSSWQSLVRGSGSIEVDYLNGEIALLGRLHSVPTPVNAMLQEQCNRLARDGGQPGSVAVEVLEASLG